MGIKFTTQANSLLQDSIIIHYPLLYTKHPLNPCQAQGHVVELTVETNCTDEYVYRNDLANYHTIICFVLLVCIICIKPVIAKVGGIPNPGGGEKKVITQRVAVARKQRGYSLRS